MGVLTSSPGPSCAMVVTRIRLLRTHHEMARLLYFGALPDRLGTASEEVDLPADVVNVHSLLAWLRGRGGEWQKAMVEGGPQVTVNKAFAGAQTPVSKRDEIAIISRDLGWGAGRDYSA